ncbi:MAG: hypothetical protein HYU36_05880 [Planctomycetes bacterium]|nr:hypothetical protein [Planctomycetota bacterium]
MKRTLMYNFRGVYGRELTHSIAFLVGKYAARNIRARTQKPKPKVYVGNDHRFSSNSLKHYLIQGYISEQMIVRDVGLVPTSVLSYAVKKAADGGCEVTASHNPPEYNGLKLFEADGSVVKPDVEDRILEEVNREVQSSFNADGASILTTDYGITSSITVISDYVHDVVNRISTPVPITVGIDCRFGTSFTILPMLLKSLKCTYYPIHHEQNPYFLKESGEYLNPEPKESNVQEISALVRYASLDFGLIFDGDSDRSVVVDDLGRYVPDDLVLLFLATEYGANPKKVITIDTSLMVEQHLRQQGYELTVTPVGDPFVARAVLEQGASFGGVPNGHYIFPDFLPYSDGLFAASVMVQIASKLKGRGMKLSEFVEQVPKTFIRKVKLPFGRSRDEFVSDVVPRLERLVRTLCRHVDRLETDDCVVMCKDEKIKLLVRYNRWDTNFNVQAESLESAEQAEGLLNQLRGVLAQI